MKCRFKVQGRFDGAGSATVEIDRASGIMRVRPCRRRRTYDLPLSVIAQIQVERIIRFEVEEKRRLKKKGK